MARTAPPRQLTRFGTPYPSLRGVHKQVLDYRRDDGVTLSGVLYLPPGHDRTGVGKLPLLIWAYPVEYKNRDSAAQVTANPNRFTRLDFKSPVFWVARGYAVMDQAAFPLISAGRSAERRVGNGGGGTCRSRWSPSTEKREKIISKKKS